MQISKSIQWTRLLKFLKRGEGEGGGTEKKLSLGEKNYI